MSAIDDVTSLVYETLAERFDETFVLGDARFQLYGGSTPLIIEVTQASDEDPVVVSIKSMLVNRVQVGPELLEYVAFHGDQHTMGHLSVAHMGAKYPTSGEVWLTHRFLGEHLDAESFTAACRMVLSTADRLDDELHRRFGGRRWFD